MLLLSVSDSVVVDKKKAVQVRCDIEVDDDDNDDEVVSEVQIFCLIICGACANCSNVEYNI